MLQFASQWLKKSVAIMTLTLMVVSSSAQAVSAFTLTSGTSGSSSGVISATPMTTTTATTVSPDLVAAIYSPSSSLLSNVKATPSSFKPSNGEQTTIHFDTSAPATVWLDIKQNGTTLNRLYFNAGFHLNAGSYDTFWNGLGDATNPTNPGKLVPDGTYQFVVTAKLDADGTVYNAQDNIIVTSSPSLQPVVITTGGASPNPFNPSLGQQTSVSYTLSAQANLNIDVMDNTTVLTQIGSSPLTQNAGTYSVSWNGKVGGVNVAAKTYYIRFTGKNDAMTTPYVTTVPVTVDYGTTPPPTTNPTVLYVYAENGSFDPTVATNRIHYAVDKAANAVVKILDSGNNVVRTFGTSSVTNGFDYFTNWDGRDDSNALVPAGNYTAKVELALTPGGTVVNNKQSSPFAVTYGGTNNNAPVVTSVTATPSSFNPTNSETTSINYSYTSSSSITNSKVEILDGSSVVRKTFNNMPVPFSWNGRDESNNILPNGTYTVKVSLTNGIGTGTGTTTVTLTNNGSTNNAPVVTSLYVSPEIFNPRQGQTSTAYYNLNQTATVTTQILDRNGVVIRTLVDNINRYSNNFAYTTSYGSYNYADQWNGRDVYGNIVPDNIYQFRVTANGNGMTDTKTAWVEVDTDGIIIGFPNGSTCAGYIDVSNNSPYCKAIELMKQLGVFTGYADGTFRPYTPINRAETVKVILLALNIAITNDSTTLFRDTDGNAWYAPYLRTAKRLGIIRGYPDGTFRPDQTINRVELLKVFLESSGVNIPYCNYAPYNDTPVNADTRWYVDYVCYAKSNGLMHDDGTGRFSPAAPMTRGDVADLFYQFENRGLYNQYNNPYVNGSYVYGYPNGTNYTNCGVNCYNCGTNYYSCNTNTNGSYPAVSSLSASPSNFNPYNSESTTIYYTLSQASSVQVQILDSNSSIRRTINGGSVSNGTNNSTSWNGRDDSGSIVSTGTYTVRVTANNSLGSGSASTTVYVNNSGTNNTSGVPVVSGIMASPISFSPNNSQTTTITYYLNRTGTMQVQVLDSFNNVRRTISNNLTAFTNTANTVVWNGRDDSNNILPNGSYTVKVLAANSNGTGTNSVGVTLY